MADLKSHSYESKISLYQLAYCDFRVERVEGVIIRVLREMLIGAAATQLH